MFADLIRKAIRPVALGVGSALLFGAYASAIGVTSNGHSIPSSVTLGSYGTFKCNLTYDSTIYGIPIPLMSMDLGAEIPWLCFDKPSYQSGSFSSMPFVLTSGGLTKTAHWEGCESFFVMGVVNKQFTVKAKADNTKTQLAYVGSFGDFDYYKNVTTKK